MNFMRLHWFDLGPGVAVAVGVWIVTGRPTTISLLLWLSLIALCLHQFEEYRYPGYFPGVMNSVMFTSRLPDRYPLNTQSALLVNVAMGWSTYGLAAILGDRAVWLGIAASLISLGNFLAHTFLFNIRGKTFYNPGQLTAMVLFLPLAVGFFAAVLYSGAASALDWTVGLLLGAVLNYVGIFKLVDWLKDTETPHVFPRRCLIRSG